MILIISYFNYLTRLKISAQKKFTQCKKGISEYWNTHSGDWHWLTEEPASVASINRSLWQASVPSFSFYFMLALSGLVATLGLLGNSVAIIIGAMIIAPLMGPIIGMAYSIVVANRRLLRRSTLTVVTGVILTILTSTFVASILGLPNIESEIVSRSNPTLIDLAIALAAGAAGAFAHSRRRIANALPGVAIAVALVPPLSVVGIGLALYKYELAIGAMLLFLTNLTGIIFSGGIVFLSQSYGSIERAKRGLSISVVILFLLGLPLGIALEELIVKESVQATVEEMIRRRTLTFSQTDIRSIEVEPLQDIVIVRMEVAAPRDSISANQIELVQEFVSREVDKPVSLQVRIIAIEVIELPVNK